MFNIADFRGRLSKRMGVSKTNLFMVDIDVIGDQVFADGDLRFFCSGAQLPGLNVSTTDYKPRSFGLAEAMPTGITLEQASFIFMVDSKLDVMKFFHQWNQKVINTNDRSLLSEVSGSLPYEMGYKDEYSGQMTIRWFTDNDFQNSMEFVLRGVFPTGIGSINLSWADNDQYAQLPVAFGCSSFSSSFQINGTSTGPTNRGTGLIELLTSIQKYGQAIGQGGSLPTGVQRWIDEYTRVKNKLDLLDNLF